MCGHWIDGIVYIRTIIFNEGEGIQKSGPTRQELSRSAVLKTLVYGTPPHLGLCLTREGCASPREAKSQTPREGNKERRQGLGRTGFASLNSEAIFLILVLPPVSLLKNDAQTLTHLHAKVSPHKDARLPVLGESHVLQLQCRDPSHLQCFLSGRLHVERYTTLNVLTWR